MIKVLECEDVRIEDLKINYNNILCSDDIKIYLKQIMEKYTNYHVNKIKQYSIDSIKQFMMMDKKLLNKNINVNIRSDYKENEKYEMDVNTLFTIMIIFNVNNFERLLLDSGLVYVLIDLFNFSHDFNIISKYISNFKVIIDKNYILFGKVWISFPGISIFKASLINYSIYTSELYKHLNRISVHLNYLYSKINSYINDESISKKMKLKKILNDKDIQNILKLYEISK